MYKYSFEKLEVWQIARVFVKNIYRIAENFPPSEQYGLTAQIKRAAISITSNLAEGSSRKTAKDQAYFTQISYSSLMELLNQLILAQDLGYISEQQLTDLRSEVEKISNKLNALRNSQLNKSTIKRINV